VKLDGKVALVTGAGRGIGRAIATKLASEGARVVVNDLDEGPAGETVGAIEAAGGEATAFGGSVTDAEFGERFVARALERYSALDIIVNNAGYTWDNVIQKMTDEQFQAMLDVHVTAPFRILRAAAEPIRRFVGVRARRQSGAGEPRRGEVGGHRDDEDAREGMGTHTPESDYISGQVITVGGGIIF
jgi:3-oxoacyl-[acyl-carrier protein] reductase